MKHGTNHIPYEVAKAIGYYVYVLRDPRDRQVFYVGKGIDNRIVAHGGEAANDTASEKARLRRINEIEADGQTVELLFLRTGIEDEATAFVVEQAVIDAFAAHDPGALTNLVKGHHSGDRGLATLDVVISRYGAAPTPPIDAPLAMVKINRVWRPDMNGDELYEATRGYWKIGERMRNEAVYVLGVAFGIVRAAYQVESWAPSVREGETGRWRFTGRPAPELAHVVGTHVRDAFTPGSQNPYRKFLDGYPAQATPS